MKTKHTQGPWKLTQDERWPYRLAVGPASGDPVIAQDLYAYSTEDKDCAAANAREGNERQRADLTLAAAAPSMFMRLLEVSMLLEHGGTINESTRAILRDEIRKTLAEATGT
jgi:hypothetical protein